jgi:hypothetical protein
MRTQMIDRLDPVVELCIQILEALRAVIGQLQGAFKTLLGQRKRTSLIGERMFSVGGWLEVE